MDSITEHKLNGLITLMLEGKASGDQMEFLYSILSESPEAVDHYVESMSLISCLLKADARLLSSVEDNNLPMDSNISLDGIDIRKGVLSDKKEDTDAGFEVSHHDNFMESLQKLAEFEASAPTVHIEKPIERPDEPPIIRPARSKQEISKFSVLTLAFSTAAMMLLLFLVRFIPAGTPLVASLGYTVDAVWGPSTEEKVLGEDLESDTYYLEKGLVQILFYNGAKVILEGPADFELSSTSSMELISGKVVANVNREAAGFTVKTPSAKVLDLGTEFGVDVDLSGNSDIHVFDGEVLLYPENNKKKIPLIKGKAKRITTSGQQRDIDLNKYAFVRQDEFNSNVKAHQGDSFNRWLSYSYQLRRDPDLVAYYTFEEDGQAPDVLRNKASLTGNMLDGDLYSAIDGELPKWTAGRWPQKTALNFDRSQRQVVVVPSDPALHVNGPITITAWVRCANPDDGGHIVSCRLSGHQEANYQLGYKFPERSLRWGKIQFGRMLNRDKVKDRIYSEQKFNHSPEWKFIAASHDNKEVRIYVDGRLIETHEFEYQQEAALADLIIGADNLAGDPLRFTGDMDELAIFKRMLAAEEVGEMYEAGKPRQQINTKLIYK